MIASQVSLLYNKIRLWGSTGIIYVGIIILSTMLGIALFQHFASHLQTGVRQNQRISKRPFKKQEKPVISACYRGLPRNTPGRL